MGLAAQSLLHSRFYQLATPSTHSFYAERINNGEQFNIHMALKLSRSEGVEEVLSLP
ncbi:hypothetical protein [Paenibacillus sp. NPDC055715]